MLVYYLQMLDTPEEKIRFEQIYLKYRGLMYHVADSVLHNRQDAEDAVHNAFLRIVKQFSRFQNIPVKDLAPQIVVIARNEATSLLRKRKDEAPLEDQEGLVLQGCGGDPQEWVDGINRELTEAGILLGGSKLENVVSFRHDGVTCLLFPFGDAELNIGKFAMWRIQTHDRYGGTWLSDYVPNRLGGFLHQPSRQKPTMSLIGMDGNIFAVMGKASSLLKEAGMGDLVSHMVQRVTTCGDYCKALNIISEYVETELSPPAIPQKSNKKKARNTYER